MADAADTTTMSSGQSILTIADLNTTVNHEPRVEDIRLAVALGMDRPHEIRRLIERHREALERFGEVCVTVTQTSRKGGRPGRTFWLNKRQCLYLCTKSETARATEATIQMVEVFDAHQKGTLQDPNLAGTAVPSTIVPLVSGSKDLVSSLDIARALGRHHGTVLRSIDGLLGQRPELLDRHFRFASYRDARQKIRHRCWHVDARGFTILMGRFGEARSAAILADTLPTFAESPSRHEMTEAQRGGTEHAAPDPMFLAEVADLAQAWKAVEPRFGRPGVSASPETIQLRRRILRLRSDEPLVDALLLKARVMTACLGGLDALDSFLDEIETERGPNEEAMAVSLALDFMGFLGTLRHKRIAASGNVSHVKRLPPQRSRKSAPFGPAVDLLALDVSGTA